MVARTWLGGGSNNVEDPTDWNLEASVRSRDAGGGKRCVRDVIEAGLN